MNLKDKVVIVTGAGSGIGAATANLFAKEGAFVVLVDINWKRIKKVGDDIAKQFKTPLLLTADVSKDEDAVNIINKTLEKFSRLDILINNAGILKLGSVMSGNSVKVLDEMIKVNLRSVVLLTTLAAPHLIKSKGNIVNLSSIAALKAVKIPLLMPYSISKIGIEHFSKAAAMELSSYGVRVNVICPGNVKTNILGLIDSARILLSDPGIVVTPLGKFSSPDEVADLICFVASDKAKSVTGSVFVIDNGMLLK